MRIYRLKKINFFRDNMLILYRLRPAEMFNDNSRDIFVTMKYSDSKPKTRYPGYFVVEALEKIEIFVRHNNIWE